MKSIWLGLALCAAAPTAVAAQAVQAPMPAMPAPGWKSALPVKHAGAGPGDHLGGRGHPSDYRFRGNSGKCGPNGRVLSALKRAGIEERDIQTSSINLNPEYRYQDNRTPQLVGYSASNQVSIRFRDIRNTGKILDALVAEGANQINGPTLTIDKPEAALDEARLKALANGRARAEVYARALAGASPHRVDQRERRKLPGSSAHADDDGGARPGGDSKILAASRSFRSRSRSCSTCSKRTRRRPPGSLQAAFKFQWSRLSGRNPYE
jgi:hypothetical protein